jgi:hypothetical protein
VITFSTAHRRKERGAGATGVLRSLVASAERAKVVSLFKADIDRALFRHHRA